MYAFFCLIACDPKLMPTFPQHRNMKKTPAKEVREPEPPVADQTNNLPAISDLVSEINFQLLLFS